MSRAHVHALVWSLAAAGLTVLAANCSLQNQEGPEVSCQDLQCGVVNACADGIIVQCADGQNVLFHVCASGDDTVCDQDWQIPGQYRCDEFQTLCEGCDPAGPGCAVGGGGAGGSSGGAGGSSGGAGGA
jgi:uncharacterized membrane protein YgcG